MPGQPPRIAVVGASSCPPDIALLARRVGASIASSGAVLLCGGRSGVMESAARGARETGGRTVGILPGRDASDSPPNPWIELPLFTGLGQARNLVLVLSAEAVVAIAGGWGTLSEIALARKHGRPVVLLESWELPGASEDADLLVARTPEDAVARALEAARRTEP